MTYPLCWIRRRHEGAVRAETGIEAVLRGDQSCVDCGVTEEDAGRIAFSEVMAGNPRGYEWDWTDLRLLDAHR